MATPVKEARPESSGDFGVHAFPMGGSCPIEDFGIHASTGGGGLIKRSFRQQSPDFLANPPRDSHGLAGLGD